MAIAKIGMEWDEEEEWEHGQMEREGETEEAPLIGIKPPMATAAKKCENGTQIGIKDEGAGLDHSCPPRLKFSL